MHVILGFLATVLGWLAAGWAGRIILSVIVQGVAVAGTIFWGGEMAEWATGKMLSFIRNSDFWDGLQKSFAAFGDLPSYVLQIWGCFGAREAFVALIGGQLSGIGVALICRKLM